MAQAAAWPYVTRPGRQAIDAYFLARMHLPAEASLLASAGSAPSSAPAASGAVIEGWEALRQWAPRRKSQI